MAERNPDKVLEFWETRCWWRDKDERAGLVGPDGMGRCFWEKIQSSDRLKQWCVTYSAQRLHPIFFILEEMYQQIFARKPVVRGKAKRLRREFQAAARTLSVIEQTVAQVPAWAITDAERKHIQKILVTAKSRRPWSTVVRMLQIREDGSEDILTFPFDGEPQAHRTGRPSPGFHFNSDLYLLSQHLRTLVGSRAYWPAVVDLIHHFRPDQSGTVKQIRDRVNLFARTHRSWLAQLKSSLYNWVDHNLSDPTLRY